MNEREEYITREITQKGEGGTARRKREAQRWGRGSRDTRGVGDSSPRARWSLLPGPFGPSDPVRFSFPPPLERVVVLSEPNFWTYSLQIHYNGLGPKTVTLQLAPSVGKLLVRR